MERFIQELNTNPDLIKLTFGKVVRCVICRQWINREKTLCIRPGMDAKYACLNHHGVRTGR